MRAVRSSPLEDIEASMAWLAARNGWGGHRWERHDVGSLLIRTVSHASCSGAEALVGGPLSGPFDWVLTSWLFPYIRTKGSYLIT